MAKYECSVEGDFNSFVNYIENGILNGSLSASLEDVSDFKIDDVNVSVRVFERYSLFGNNRLSMNITFVNKGYKTLVSVITSGGSSGAIKIFSIGEHTFLDKFKELMEDYK